jgi:histidinol dehydrogenase
LVIADLLKVNEIYKIGGGQAIAATGSSARKSSSAWIKIVGYGNLYVTEARGRF